MLDIITSVAIFWVAIVLFRFIGRSTSAAVAAWGFLAIWAVAAIFGDGFATKRELTAISICWIGAFIFRAFLASVRRLYLTPAFLDVEDHPRRWIFLAPVGALLAVVGFFILAQIIPESFGRALWWYPGIDLRTIGESPGWVWVSRYFLFSFLPSLLWDCMVIAAALAIALLPIVAATMVTLRIRTGDWL